VWNEYTHEKLQELDSELKRSREQRPRLCAAPRAARRPLAPVARATGRRVRRLGEALEAWASPAAQ